MLSGQPAELTIADASGHDSDSPIQCHPRTWGCDKRMDMLGSVGVLQKRGKLRRLPAGKVP